MKLLPALKQKKRYIAFKAVSEAKLSTTDLKTAVNDAILHYLGQFGIAQSSPEFLKEKCKNNHFIVKVNHKYVDHIKSALLLIKKIKNKPVIIQSITTSGTLKKASSYL